MGVSDHREQRVAGRNLQGRGQLFSGGDFTQFKSPGGWRHFRRRLREVYGPTALTANTWAHLAATYDGATMRLYVNGAQVASQAQTGAIATSTNPLQIGGDSLYGGYFAGQIDEVRIYDRALNIAEIQSDMNTPVGTPTPSSNADTYRHHLRRRYSYLYIYAYSDGYAYRNTYRHTYTYADSFAVTRG